MEIEHVISKPLAQKRKQKISLISTNKKEEKETCKDFKQRKLKMK